MDLVCRSSSGLGNEQWRHLQCRPIQLQAKGDDAAIARGGAKALVTISWIDSDGWPCGLRKREPQPISRLEAHEQRLQFQGDGAGWLVKVSSNPQHTG